MNLIDRLQNLDGLIYAGERRHAHEELCAILQDLMLRDASTPVPKIDAARNALAAIERVYLRAAGFCDVGGDYWTPPLGGKRFRFMVYRTGHAINALKLFHKP